MWALPGKADRGSVRPALDLPHWYRSLHTAGPDGTAPRRLRPRGHPDRSGPVHGSRLPARRRQRADTAPVPQHRDAPQARALRDADAENPGVDPSRWSHWTTRHSSAMLAWGLPSGVGGAYENTLIPEWRRPVKRLTHMTGQSGAACPNVPTSICDLHPPRCPPLITLSLSRIRRRPIT